MTQQVALIVGGSSGMGKETAFRLVAKGLTTIILAHDPQGLEEAKAELETQGPGRVETAQVDLYDSQQVTDFINQLEKEERHLKYLVNAAGFFKPISFLEHTEEDYDAQLDMNKAFFFITQAVVKNMKKHHGGSIVNIGSMWAHQAVKATPSSAYSMQKAGLHSLTKNLAVELGEFNIRVNSVAPAVVVSPIYKAFIEEDKIEESLSGFQSLHPLGRLGRPKDIADGIDFLLSDKADWITGTILNVDGGVMAGHS
ncbi:SDR family NAD(P)-dependent oxidoreductase [Pseudobacteriovorax antillogorgiicola]|uniref:NAD(P)-dependent dehydrogenase, short-chain alcohol dehydrogenase family n=1 Tax=Pseudobacteriovorax antillogorgiicola TaxID=1513793 RepID=A0A1Y6CWD9_9BACT|nr:SDR family oxidoreductase [Pseudobacteriovorax antillogorgiicola]TCS41798.1 NAD(P)-dependent dehydrogenase (short-subunit alcohol dehydrogenase family) [Pseudobacteriovorax antillogorgiicola]SMF83479.1 NAD(P)-dependent dehydrogenase, short-chain alcohol dehydrogenase family [Pseudobacteriovorax antillogorgiicola]